MTPAEQLADEIDVILSALGPLTGHLDLAASPARCARVCAELAQDDDPKLAAEACLTVICALWPTAAPEDCGQAEWWRSPLGLLCARSLGRDDLEVVTHSVAAEMLDVTRGTIGVLVHRGALERHPDGGVSRASVLARLARPPKATP
jgi:hypothetical protein